MRITAFTLALFLYIFCAQLPSHERHIASTEASFTPQQALLDAASEELVFQRWALLPGSETIGSCIFQNSKVLVIYHLCSKKGKEAPAFAMDIISFQGGMNSFYIESSDDVAKLGHISTVTRANYDRSWRISFFNTPSLPADLSPDALKNLLQDALPGRTKYSSCYTGGMMVKSAQANCDKVSALVKNAWGTSAVEFWTNPGSDWYAFLKLMRDKVLIAPKA